MTDFLLLRYTDVINEKVVCRIGGTATHTGKFAATHPPLLVVLLSRILTEAPIPVTLAPYKSFLLSISRSGPFNARFCSALTFYC